MDRRSIEGWHLLCSSSHDLRACVLKKSRISFRTAIRLWLSSSLCPFTFFSMLVEVQVEWSVTAMDARSGANSHVLVAIPYFERLLCRRNTITELLRTQVACRSIIPPMLQGIMSVYPFIYQAMPHSHENCRAQLS
jgi:hypothetical protein